MGDVEEIPFRGKLFCGICGIDLAARTRVWTQKGQGKPLCEQCASESDRLSKRDVIWLVVMGIGAAVAISGVWGLIFP